MKTKTIYLFSLIVGLSLLSACGGEEQSKQQAQKESMDKSVKQAPQQQNAKLKKQQADSMMAAVDKKAEVGKAGKNERSEKAEKRGFNPMVQRASSGAEGNYVVQVSSWRSKDKAQRLAGRWQSRGFEHAYVVKYGNKETGNIWFRVRLGDYFTKTEASELQAWLQNKYGRKSWIMYIK